MNNRFNPPRPFRFTHQKYLDLLTILTGLLLISSLFKNQISVLPIGPLLFLWAIFLMLKAISLPKSLLWILRGVAIVAMVFDFVRLPNDVLLNRSFSITSTICYSIFLGITIIIMSKRIFTEDIITEDTIIGGICIYLMIGLVWNLFYELVVLVDGNAFDNVDEGVTSTSQKLLYFSFTTLTTLGYGDILPISGLAMTLTNLEAIIGQMFPAIFIARLVGLYSQGENIKGQQIKDNSNIGEEKKL
jgi:hypothetical protein